MVGCVVLQGSKEKSWLVKVWKKYIGNPKRNKEKEIGAFPGLTDLLVRVRGMSVMNS